MKEYESPKAELLQLEDVITASGAAEPCKCWQVFSLPTPDSEGDCMYTDSFGGFESKTGV